MNDYVVARKKDNSGLVIIGSFPDNAFVVEIPPDDPERKTYIDLFLHRADMTIGMSSLEHIQSSNDVSLNEPLFVMKTVSKARHGKAARLSAGNAIEELYQADARDESGVQPRDWSLFK